MEIQIMGHLNFISEIRKNYDKLLVIWNYIKQVQNLV